MPICRNNPSIPNVRASSATIGTMFLLIDLFFSKIFNVLTKASVVDISRDCSVNKLSNSSSGGTLNLPENLADRCGR